MSSALSMLQQSVASLKDGNLSTLPEDARLKLIATSQAFTRSLQKPSETIFGTVGAAVCNASDRRLWYFQLSIAVDVPKHSDPDMH